MDDADKERFDKTTENTVFNRSDYTNWLFSINRAQAIPETHRKDWENAKEKIQQLRRKV